MTAVAWAGDRADDGDALRRLGLDNDDLRAENARLKGSIGQRQDEIVALGERVERLHVELAEARRSLSEAHQTLAEAQGQLAKRSLRRWVERARRLARLPV